MEAFPPHSSVVVPWPTHPLCFFSVPPSLPIAGFSPASAQVLSPFARNSARFEKTHPQLTPGISREYHLSVSLLVQVRAFCTSDPDALWVPTAWPFSYLDFYFGVSLLDWKIEGFKAPQQGKEPILDLHAQSQQPAQARQGNKKKVLRKERTMRKIQDKKQQNNCRPTPTDMTFCIFFKVEYCTAN